MSLFTQRVFVDTRRKDGGFTAPVEPSSPTPVARQRHEGWVINRPTSLTASFHLLFQLHANPAGGDPQPQCYVWGQMLEQGHAASVFQSITPVRLEEGVVRRQRTSAAPPSAPQRPLTPSTSLEQSSPKDRRRLARFEASDGWRVISSRRRAAISPGQ